MKKSVFRFLTVVFVLAIFAATSVCAVAADKKWFLTKDKNGVCKVIQANDKTPTTIAGPFTKKSDAEKAKAEQCPKKDKKDKADKKKQ
ncbi:MAG: hypothetical protein AB7V04_12745 [Desulfomonilaceae bacterium]|nr:hypothetical protein [Syntrophaceae bacterium]